jgi:FkbM family methyltransferase
LAGLKTQVARLLPNRLKVALRPTIRKLERLSARPFRDSSSALAIGSFGGFDLAYRRGSADEAVIAQSLGDDGFFPGVPEYHPAEEDVVVDIGAHIGTFSLLASTKARRGRIYAVEACRDTFNFLRLNVALNKADNISVHHLAISDRQGTCRLYYDAGNWGNSTVRRLSRYGEDVTCCTLSDFLDANRIERCSFLKMNCEGAEFPILLSTSGRALQRINVILALYHCDLWSRHTEMDLLAHLRSCGFHAVLRNVSRRNGWIVATNAASGDSMRKP